MTLKLNISATAEVAIRAALGPDLDRAALDALLIEGYRTGKLSTGDIADALGFKTRHEAEQWLCQRHVEPNYTQADLDADRETLSCVLGPVSRN